MPEDLRELSELVADYFWHDREQTLIREEIKTRRTAAALYKAAQIVEAHVSIKWGSPVIWRKARIEYLSAEIKRMSYIVRVKTSAGKWSHRTVRVREDEIRPLPEEKN